MKRDDDEGQVIYDEDKLCALLETRGLLSKTEFASFEDMRNKCSLGERLSPKQRDWVRSRFRQLGLASTFTTAENLVSSGVVKTGTPEDAASKAALERMMGPKSTRPPPSSRRSFGYKAPTS